MALITADRWAACAGGVPSPHARSVEEQMSYDIRLVDPITRETLQTDRDHQLRGGTYAMGGTDEAWLNITCNYSPHFRRVLDENQGIRVLYGKTALESLPLLASAVQQLGDDVSSDYWAPTEGNARKALLDLMQLAIWLPHGVWDGD